MTFGNRKKPSIEVVTILLIVLSILLLAVDAMANAQRYSVPQIERIILWSVRGETCAPSSLPVLGDPEYRTRVAQAIVDASERYNLPALYLVAIAHRETRYRTNQVGDSGRSLGMMQVGKMGRRVCRPVCSRAGTERATVEGDVMCGACWLDAGRGWCGSLQGALSAYVSGQCTPKSKRAKMATRGRERMIEQMGQLK
jgi:hypothetical protein